MRRLTGLFGAAVLTAGLVGSTAIPALAWDHDGGRPHSAQQQSHQSSHHDSGKGKHAHFGGVTVVRAGESIQDAIDAGDPGDTIIVKSGTYAEHLSITKTIKLLSWGATLTAPAAAGAPTPCSGTDAGEDGICIAGVFTVSPEGEVTVTDAVDNVVVAGFHIVGFGGSGINQIGGQDSTFAGNFAEDNAEYGFAAFSSNGTTMAFNKATGSEEAGFYVGDSHPADAKLFGNRASDNGLGLFVRNAEHVSIWANRSSANCAGMLFLADAPGPAGDINAQWNSVTDNTKVCPPAEGPPFSGLGVVILGAHDVTLKHNWITGNVASGPTFATGGVVLTSLDPVTGTPPANNTVQKNLIKNNDPDINWDGSGTGNVLEPNRCETSIPAGLCDDGV